MTRLVAMTLSVLAATFLAGCRGSGAVMPSGEATAPPPGTTVLRLDTSLAVVETIPLTRRPVVPRGIAADRFYVYCYDDNALYRQPKGEPVTTVWLNNVRVTGLAGYSTGEMLVADGDRNVIWYKTIFGESRRFLDAADITRPGAMATLPGGRFAVLVQDRSVFILNRAGIRERRIDLNADFDLLAADTAGTLYLGRSSGPELLRVGEGTRTAFRLPGVPGAGGIAWLAGRLVVLDRGNRLTMFRLP
jgi:hypothetical protein